MSNFNFPDKFKPLLRAVIDQHALDVFKSDHGLHHWLRVIDIGCTIADNTPGVDKDIIIAFGLLHDSARRNEQHCLKHGPEALGVIRNLQDIIPLDQNQLLMLMIACSNHTSGDVDDFPIHEPTIHACFDSDRLDLLRVGIVPDSRFLFTDFAKVTSFQAWANKNANEWAIPEWAADLYIEVQNGK